MLGQCQGKTKVGSGMLQGVELEIVLHLSVNMVVSTINLPMKKKFSCLYVCSGGKKNLMSLVVLKRTSFALSLFKVN